MLVCSYKREYYIVPASPGYAQLCNHDACIPWKQCRFGLAGEEWRRRTTVQQQEESIHSNLMTSDTESNGFVAVQTLC